MGRERAVKSAIDRQFMQCCSCSGVKPMWRVACRGQRSGAARWVPRSRSMAGRRAARMCQTHSCCAGSGVSPAAECSTRLSTARRRRPSAAPSSPVQCSGCQTRSAGGCSEAGQLKAQRWGGSSSSAGGQACREGQVRRLPAAAAAAAAPPPAAAAATSTGSSICSRSQHRRTRPTEGMMTMQAPAIMAAAQGQNTRGRRWRSSRAWARAMPRVVHCVVSWTAAQDTRVQAGGGRAGWGVVAQAGGEERGGRAPPSVAALAARPPSSIGSCHAAGGQSQPQPRAAHQWTRPQSRGPGFAASSSP